MTLSKNLRIVVDRKTNPTVKVMKGGPFFEGYIDGVLIGKVMTTATVHIPTGTDCADRCLRYKHHVILLTEQELADINYELHTDAEKREQRDKPLFEE
jgi:hypothetical protein